MQNNKETSIILAIIGTIISLIVAEIPVGLNYKIAASLVFVVYNYIYLIRRIVKRGDFLSIYTVLLFLSIPFYYGQHIIALIDPNYLISEHDFSILDGIIPDRYIIYATFLGIDSLLIMFAGYASVPLKNIDYDSSIDLSKQKALKTIGWLTFLLSVYPAFHLVLAEYQLTLINGYLGRRMLETEGDYFQLLGVSYLEIMIAQFFLPAIYALLIAYKGKKYNRVLFGILIVYCLAYSMTGSRFTVLKIIVCIVLIIYTWIKKPTYKDFRRLAVFGLGAAIFFTVGSIIRNVGIDTVNGGDIKSNLDLYDTFWESGITFSTISNILYRCPSAVDFFYGKSYLGAVLQCIPGASSLSFFSHNNLHVSATFSPLYYGADSLVGYGSSFIAEAYYNFGYLALFFIYWLGRAFAKVKNSMINAQNMGNPLSFLFCVCACGELAYAVRNDLCNIPRTLLYSVGIIVILSLFINKLNKR